jgi:hypothetical protein
MERTRFMRAEAFEIIGAHLVDYHDDDQLGMLCQKREGE